VRSNDRSSAPKSDIEERVVFVNRCSKVVKGGRRFSFSAIVVVGNHEGLMGYGFGKANEVADAIKKGGEIARKSMFPVTMRERTIPHEVIGEFSGGRVLLRPAAPGTGVIAGGGVRAVLEVAGYRDVLAKSLGSNNKVNVVKATVAALNQLRSKEEISKVRQVAL
jgi:small subunit ribosomal protein S5